MNAVCRVDLKGGFSIYSDDLVDTSRAVALAGFAIKWQVGVDRYPGISKSQVARLVFFMLGGR